MNDQAHPLRQLVLAGRVRFAGPAAPPRTLLVLGAQRGVGATTVAVHLALTLAREGVRTAFLDGDLASPDATALLRLDDRTTLVEVLRGEAPLHAGLQAGPGGLLALPGPWGRGDTAEYTRDGARRLLAELEQLGPHVQRIVIDGGCQFNEGARAFWRAAEQVVLVAAANELSIMDGYGLLKQLAATHPRAEVEWLVNLAEDTAETQAALARLRGASERFLGLTLRPLGCVPHDPRVAAAQARRLPAGLVVPSSSALAALERVVGQGHLEPRRAMVPVGVPLAG